MGFLATLFILPLQIHAESAPAKVIDLNPKIVDSWVSDCTESTWGVTCEKYGGKDFPQTKIDLPSSCTVSDGVGCPNMSICDLKNWVRIVESPEPCSRAKAIICPDQNAKDVFRNCRDSCNRSQNCLANCVENYGCNIAW